MSQDARVEWVDPDHAELPLTRQCELAGVPRASVYRRLTALSRQAGEKADDLKLRSLIDEEYTSRPFYGSRRMVVFLRTWPLKAVRDECMTTFLAGHETVAATLTWWAWCMAAHPEAQAMAAREVRDVVRGSPLTAQTLPALSYLTQTLQETLRLYPAAPFLLSRRALRPITLGGWQLPARTMFMVPVQLMHHDARWFPDPLAFRPERFAQAAISIPRGAFMPFGTGPRVCLGQHVAMTEMTVIAAKFLQHFTVKVPDGMAAPEPVFNITLRPREPLRLALYPGTS